jgi:hypothetical protein
VEAEVEAEEGTGVLFNPALTEEVSALPQIERTSSTGRLYFEQRDEIKVSITEEYSCTIVFIILFVILLRRRSSIVSVEIDMDIFLYFSIFYIYIHLVVYNCFITVL